LTDSPPIRKAVIPAAGLGTRFLPATKAQPKEMLPLVDTPVIQYVVDEVVACGIDDLLIVTGRGKRAIEDYFDRALELEMFLDQRGKKDLLNQVRDLSNYCNIYFVRQKEPRGLGDAIYAARRHVGGEPFAVLLADEVFAGDRSPLAQLLDAYDSCRCTIVAVKEVPWEEVGRYGIVAGELVGRSLYRVVDLVEKPSPGAAPSNLAIVGRYLMDPEIFDCLERTAPGVGGEIQLTDALRLLRERQEIYALVVEGERYDVGDKRGFLEATVKMALGRSDLGGDFAKFLEEVLRQHRWYRDEAAAGRAQ